MALVDRFVSGVLVVGVDGECAVQNNASQQIQPGILIPAQPLMNAGVAEQQDAKKEEGMPAWREAIESQRHCPHG
jgi:hypothetical protein